ncbi:hypothetical protein FNF31_07634 [Cafeteria roenbergensis]|uniref:Phospholipid/glycerol acyltransferase domain-containing protein n=1 Tax=Cafeteria roenbergensis TaxID=33653 RepID=A0A5A8C2P9_CAFRO|nr:hypothetical protein FNF31_07634 [Cafeteria roenbergensis]
MRALMLAHAERRGDVRWAEFLHPAPPLPCSPENVLYFIVLGPIRVGAIALALLACWLSAMVATCCARGHKGWAWQQLPWVVGYASRMGMWSLGFDVQVELRPGAEEALTSCAVVVAPHCTMLDFIVMFAAEAIAAQQRSLTTGLGGGNPDGSAGFSAAEAAAAPRRAPAAIGDEAAGDRGGDSEDAPGEDGGCCSLCCATDVGWGCERRRGGGGLRFAMKGALRTVPLLGTPAETMGCVFVHKHSGPSDTAAAAAAAAAAARSTESPLAPKQPSGVHTPPASLATTPASSHDAVAPGVQSRAAAGAGAAPLQSASAGRGQPDAAATSTAPAAPSARVGATAPSADTLTIGPGAAGAAGAASGAPGAFDALRVAAAEFDPVTPWGRGRVMIFPEGTTSNGTALTRFRTGAFASSAAAGWPCVQPAGITWPRARTSLFCRYKQPDVAGVWAWGTESGQAAEGAEAAPAKPGGEGSSSERPALSRRAGVTAEAGSGGVAPAAAGSAADGSADGGSAAGGSAAGGVPALPERLRNVAAGGRGWASMSWDTLPTSLYLYRLMSLPPALPPLALPPAPPRCRACSPLFVLVWAVLWVVTLVLEGVRRLVSLFGVCPARQVSVVFGEALPVGEGPGAAARAAMAAQAACSALTDDRPCTQSEAADKWRLHGAVMAGRTPWHWWE